LVEVKEKKREKGARMQPYINYEGKKIYFSIPRGWDLISAQDKSPISVVTDPTQEIRHALDHPIRSQKIEELARPGMEVVVLFDDLQRPTLSRLQGRIFSHDSHASDNVPIGRSHRGTLVEVNQHVAFSDLIIGIGECMPHPIAGFGGGCKIIMPGVCSYRSVADHHFTWMRHRNSKVNYLDGNLFYEEIVDVGRLARLAFKLDLVMNEKRKVIRAFAGDPVAEHREASQYAASLYLVPLPKLADVTIVSAFPLEVGVQASKALDMAAFCTRAGGSIIWIAPQKDAGSIMPLLREMASTESAGDYHRRLIEGHVPDHLKAFGISYIMQIVYFKEKAEKFAIFHVTEGLSPDQVDMMKFSYSPNLQDAINRVAEKMPQADVAVFSSGGAIIPEIH